MFTSADYRKARQHIRKQQFRLLWAAMREVKVMAPIALMFFLGIFLGALFSFIEERIIWLPLEVAFFPATVLFIIGTLVERAVLLRNPDYLWAVYHISLTPRSERTT